MSSNSDEQIVRRPLRILTIDNGGLQAISILCVLNEVCEKLSEKDGHSTTLQPYQLFDIIAGIGTGGWLAILLGRYRLRIDQCMSIYVNIANAINPTKQRRGDPAGGPVAISRSVLIEKIDKIIGEHDIGEYLVDRESDQPADAKLQQCHAFAVGVIKRANMESKQQYRLFRTYHPSSEVKYQGPDPEKCKVSLACAATAAARDFLNKCDLDGETYWDDSFPLTHNVSDLALDEADSIFGKDSELDFVLNISPGVVSPADAEKLERTASMHGSKAPMKPRRKWSPKRFFSFNTKLPETANNDPQPHMWTAADFGKIDRRTGPTRSETSSSTTSSNASDRERGHQEDIRRRLRHDSRTADRRDIYFRLELTGVDKPYLDDVAMPDHAMKLAQEYLKQDDAKLTLNQIANDWRKSVTGRDLTTTPLTSCSDFHVLPLLEAK